MLQNYKLCKIWFWTLIIQSLLWLLLVMNLKHNIKMITQFRHNRNCYIHVYINGFLKQRSYTVLLWFKSQRDLQDSHESHLPRWKTDVIHSFFPQLFVSIRYQVKYSALWFFVIWFWKKSLLPQFQKFIEAMFPACFTRALSDWFYSIIMGEM